MKVVSLTIEEQLGKNGKPYNALYVITDDKDNPKKLIGFVNRTNIKCVPMLNKDKEQ